MDAEHRHELKTNELADFIGHFPEFLKNNAKTIIGVALILAAVIVYIYGKNIKTDSNTQAQAQATSLVERLNFGKMQTIQSLQKNQASPDSMLVSASSLEIAAGEAKTTQQAALLLIKQGEALRADLHYNTEEVDADIVQNRIDQARAAYEKALTNAKGNATLEGMAKIGLALCAEEIDDYIKAEEIYKSIIADESFAGTIAPKQAQGRLDNMADNKAHYIFVKGPDPLPVPPTITAPGPKDIIEITAPKTEVAPQDTTITPVEEPAIEPEKPADQPEMK
jgi:predicted negative regulator of RcsB-dependent stress response